MPHTFGEICKSIRQVAAHINGVVYSYSLEDQLRRHVVSINP